MRGKKITQEQIIQQFKEIHGDKYLYDRVEYINAKTKVWIGCKIEEHGYFEQIPDNHKRGQGCQICGRAKTKNDKTIIQGDVIEQFISVHGEKYLYNKVDYINGKSKVLIGCKEEGHGYFEQTPNAHKQGQGCPKCSAEEASKNNRFELSKISELYNTNIREILSIEPKKVNSSKGTRVIFKCLVEDCGYIGSTSLGNMQSGSNCPACVGKVVTKNNCLATKRPDLIKYLVDKKDGYNYVVNSNKRINVICPDCGKIKTKPIRVIELSNNGFSCEKCSDGISIPEKFVYNLFSDINIDFIPQYSPQWINRKRYDFYFYNKICEVHGIQHYEQSPRGRSLKEEQENDLLKYNLAIENGIKPENYIVIDCRKSTFEWLKSNCIKELGNIFDLSNVDWSKIWEDCQSSLVVKVWNAWNNKNKDDTVLMMVDKFKISRSTIVNYLKLGDELGKCVYDVKEEKRKNIDRNRKLKQKKKI